MPEIARTPDGCLQAGTGASWEHFHHVADVGIRGIGPTLGSAFEQAAKAMTAAVTNPAGAADWTFTDVSESAGTAWRFELPLPNRYLIGTPVVHKAPSFSCSF